MAMVNVDHPVPVVVDHPVPVVANDAVAIIDDHAVAPTHYRGRPPNDDVRIVHHDATCPVLDHRCRGPDHHVGNDRVERRLDDPGRRNHHGRRNERRGLHDPGRRPFHGNHHRPRHDGRGPRHRRRGNHSRLDRSRRRREQRLTMSLPVEVKPRQAGPGLLALEDQQRLLVVVGLEVRHRFAPLVRDAEAGQLLVGGRGAEVELDVEIHPRLGRVIRPGAIERQHLGHVPACRAGGCSIRGAGLLSPEIRDAKQQCCCDQ
jgi:hypothetical protein